MSGSGRVTPQARWALLICLLALGCFFGTNLPAHAEPVGETAIMVETAHHEGSADGHEQKQSNDGHCVDSGEQCHQGVLDQGSASAPSGHTDIAVAAGTVGAQAVTIPPGTRPPRPPDLHALCVNRI